MRSRNLAENLDDEILLASQILASGGVVAVPTDTTYGLAVDPFNDAAVERVFRIKGRPEGAPLPLLLATTEEMSECAAEVPEHAWRLAELFWPGPLTLVLRKAERVPAVVSGGGDTVALRVPGHAVPRRIVSALRHPITGTSANLSGGQAAITADEVQRAFGDELDLIVVSTVPPNGVASTVLDLSERVPRIVRPGAVTPREIEKAIGCDVTVD